jgi:signal transduction histidine kinase/CheY-like chemotaxis protein
VRLHSLLERQIRRYFGDISSVPPEWSAFLDLVNSAYREFDVDREMLERSLDLSSQELLEANAEMRAVFQAGPDVYMWLDYEGLVTRVQAGRSGDLYLPARSLIGKRIHDVPDARAARKLDQALRQVQQTRATVAVEYELAIFGKTESYEARLFPLVNGKLLAIIRNTTSDRRVEEERLRAQKLESVGLLAGGIAHDFNNLLTVMLANLSLAGSYARGIPDLQEILSEAVEASHRAKELTGQLLTFARGGTPVRETASVADLVKASASFALRGSRARHELAVARDLLDTDIDVGQINQVLHNLIINAEQAMPAGGTIAIGAENVTIAGDERPPLLPGKYVRIFVKDEGIGIPEKYLDHIFDPYFTTKEKGSGLGLATSYSIVRKHDGLITVESRIGEGSTFSVFLPASEKPANGRAAPERGGLAAGSGRVLVMDDEETVLLVAQRILKTLGYSATPVRSGTEAIAEYAAARERSEPFDAAIMDLTIPGGMGGREAIGRLKELDPAVKAIASSGYSNDPVMANYRDYGFAAVLAKPYTVDDLATTLSRVVANDG